MEPDTKENKLKDYIYMKSPNKQNSFVVEKLAEAQREKKAQDRTIQSSKTKAMSFYSVDSQQLLGFAGFW